MKKDTSSEFRLLTAGFFPKHQCYLPTSPSLIYPISGPSLRTFSSELSELTVLASEKVIQDQYHFHEAEISEAREAAEEDPEGGIRLASQSETTGSYDTHVSGPVRLWQNSFLRSCSLMLAI